MAWGVQVGSWSYTVDGRGPDRAVPQDECQYKPASGIYLRLCGMSIQMVPGVDSGKVTNVNTIGLSGF